MSYDYIFKLVFIGQCYAGKTAVTERIAAERFLPAYNSTIGVDFSSIITTVNNTDRIKIHIWDTAGNEAFGPIISTYYRGVAGAFILFDLTNRNSFQKISFWINEIKEKGDNPDMPLVLVGNKLDLESKRVITTEEAQIIAKHYDMQYFEVSAKTGENVHNAFEALIKEIYENMDKEKLGIGIRAHFSKENELLLNQPKKNDNVLFDCCCMC